MPPAAQCAPQILVDASDAAHWDELIACLRQRGFQVQRAADIDPQWHSSGGAVWLVDTAAAARAPQRPFLVIAGGNSAATLAAAVEAGASGFFVAPVEMLSLAAAISIADREARATAGQAQHADRLSSSVEENRMVGVVVGILMERYHLLRDDAFERLRSYSRSQRLRVSEVARQVLVGTENHTSLANEIWKAETSGQQLRP